MEAFCLKIYLTIYLNFYRSISFSANLTLGATFAGDLLAHHVRIPITSWPEGIHQTKRWHPLGRQKPLSRAPATISAAKPISLPDCRGGRKALLHAFVPNYPLTQIRHLFNNGAMWIRIRPGLTARPGG